MDGGGHELYPGGGAQVGHGGHGDGHHAVGAADGSVALAEAGYDDLVNAQVVKADGDGADVHDGVHGAHLVEHDGVRRGAVRLGLRLGKLAKDGQGKLLGAGGQPRGVDDGAHVRERAVRVVVPMPVIVAVSVLVAVLGLVLVAVLVPPVVVVMVLVLVRAIFAKEPGHVVVVVLVLVVQDDVKVAGGEAALGHAAHAGLKPVDR